MKKWLIMIVVGAIIALGACGGGDENTAPNNNNETNVSLDAEELIKNNCIDCHGGEVEKVPGSHLDLAELKEVILEGSGGMPAIDVSDEEAEAIASYLMD